MIELTKVKWGVSNYYSNPERIEINEHLLEPEFEDLKDRVIAHEMEHHRANKFKKKSFWKQRKVDALTDLKFSHLFKFYKKYPKSFFQQNIPFNYSKERDTLFIEWSRIFLILVYSGIGIGIYSLIRLFSTDSIFFWKVMKYIAILLGVCFVLYFIGKMLRNSVNKRTK